MHSHNLARYLFATTHYRPTLLFRLANNMAATTAVLLIELIVLILVGDIDYTAYAFEHLR